MTLPGTESTAPSLETDQQFYIDRIRGGDQRVWKQFIDRYEGRLLAYVTSRLNDKVQAEDVVQETFLGFLTSLPNYDAKRSLESYLFAIAAYKITDQLRKSGRRPALSNYFDETDVASAQNLHQRGRRVSSAAQSVERRNDEEAAIIEVLSTQIAKWIESGDWTKLKCIELLFISGATNKNVSERLSITEQQVANYKSDFVQRTRTLVNRLAPNASFPELP